MDSIYIAVELCLNNQSENTNFYLFDSYSRSPKGFKVPTRGVICCHVLIILMTCIKLFVKISTINLTVTTVLWSNCWSVIGTNFRWSCFTDRRCCSTSKWQNFTLRFVAVIQKRAAVTYKRMTGQSLELESPGKWRHINW